MGLACIIKNNMTELHNLPQTTLPPPLDNTLSPDNIPLPLRQNSPPSLQILLTRHYDPSLGTLHADNIIIIHVCIAYKISDNIILACNISDNIIIIQSSIAYNILDNIIIIQSRI